MTVTPGLLSHLTSGYAVGPTEWNALVDALNYLLAPTFAVKIHHSTTQSIADSTYTAVQCDTEDWDPSGMHDPVTNPTRITIPAGGDGKYLVEAFAYYVAAPGLLEVRKNGVSSPAGGDLRIWNHASSDTSLLISEEIQLVAGDYLELWTLQNSGGAANLGIGTQPGFQSRFSLRRLSE